MGIEKYFNNQQFNNAHYHYKDNENFVNSSILTNKAKYLISPPPQVVTHC